MKVAIIVNGTPPECTGGTEVATMKMAEAAAKRGHDIHIVSLCNSALRSSCVIQQGVHVHRVPAISARYLRSLACISSVTAVLTRIKSDIVHVQGIYMSPAVVLAKCALKKPYLYSERGSLHVSVPAKSLLYSVVLNHAARIVAQTEYQKRTLQNYTKRPIEVIPSGVDASLFGVIGKQEARDRLGLPKDAKIVLSVNRCRPEKNLRDFVLAALLDNMGTVYLLVGDGEQLPYLKGLAGWRVVFAGGVDNSRVPLYLSAADVLVNTSLSEGFPMSILEGMASGLPIVAPRVCGIPEIVEDGVNGFLSEPQDYKSTVWLVNFLLENPRIRSKISDANKLKARRYTWETVVTRLYG